MVASAQLGDLKYRGVLISGAKQPGMTSCKFACNLCGYECWSHAPGKKHAKTRGPGVMM